MFKKKSVLKNLEHPVVDEDLSVGKQLLVFFWEIFKVVVISLAIIVPIRYFLIKPFYVKGASMEPNFHDREYLIINEISYRFEEPQRGESIVFKYPLDGRQYFIKRIIGLPGEIIKISDGKVSIAHDNNSPSEILIEDYLLPAMKTLGEVEVELGDDEYYLLGDNRLASLDSRFFGPVKRQFIVGKTLLRGWPLDRFGLVLFTGRS